LLRESQGSVKQALLMARHGINAQDARERLDRSGGQLRSALE